MSVIAQRGIVRCISSISGHDVGTRCPLPPTVIQEHFIKHWQRQHVSVCQLFVHVPLTAPGQGHWPEQGHSNPIGPSITTD